MKDIVSFDPGYAIGMAVGEFSDTEPLKLVDAMIVDYPSFAQLVGPILSGTQADYVVSEKFVLSSGNDFTADLTAVKVEGQLESVFPEIHWRQRSDKVQVSDDLLKRIGWWKTGEDVEWDDGRDANDAIIHMLGFVAFELNHIPTLRAYFRDTE